MVFVKIEDGVVVQKQPYAQEGFIEAPDDVCCGQIMQEDGSFSNPPPDPEAEKAKKRSELLAEQAAIDIKKIRALSEPGIRPADGENPEMTWIEWWNKQAARVRADLATYS